MINAARRFGSAGVAPFLKLFRAERWLFELLKTSNLNVAAGIFFLLIALMDFCSVVLFPALNPELSVVSDTRYGFILPVHIVFSLVFLLLSVAAFRPRFRPLALAGFGVGFLCAAALLIENIHYLNAYFNTTLQMVNPYGSVSDTLSVLKQAGAFPDFVKTTVWALLGQTDSAIALALPMLVALLFAVIAMAQNGKKPLRMWFVPGVVSALCALCAVGVSVAVLAHGFTTGDNAAGSIFRQAIASMIVLVVHPLFGAGVFCYMKYYSNAAKPAQTCMPGDTAANGYPADDIKLEDPAADAE